MRSKVLILDCSRFSDKFSCGGDELFGFEGVSYYLIAVAVSYATSGYYSLYKDQTIVYSKYKAKFVNQKTKS